MSEKLYTLIIMACKQSGTYNPNDTLHHVVENLTPAEHKEAEDFLNWVNAEPHNRHFGHGTIKSRYLEFKHQ